jgi:tRNA A37 N6-isopentenylltransferase MiaA
MAVDNAIKIFVSYSSEDKKEFLAHLMYELTVIARDSYVVDQDFLTNPQRVRRINEVQHRVSAFLWELLRNDPQRYPDDILVRIILEHPDDNDLQQQLTESFARLTSHHLTTA